MTVAQLKQQMDQRFDEQRGRLDAGFGSLHDKLNAILQILDKKSDHHFKILNEHDERLKELERGRRAT